MLFSREIQNIFTIHMSKLELHDKALKMGLRRVHITFFSLMLFWILLFQVIFQTPFILTLTIMTAYSHNKIINELYDAYNENIRQYREFHKGLDNERGEENS